MHVKLQSRRETGYSHRKYESEQCFQAVGAKARLALNDGARQYRSEMSISEKIHTRFNELQEQSSSVRVLQNSIGHRYVDSASWHQWTTSALNLLQMAFGSESLHYKNLKTIYDAFRTNLSDLDAARGVFMAAKADFEGGYTESLERAVSGEIFGNFIALAKQSLSDGHKDVAAVLACAALEDALKKYARNNGVDVADEVMQKVVAALKAKGLVGGAHKALLDVMPKIRDYAMHANWDKISPADVSSVVGFVEQFLLTNF